MSFYYRNDDWSEDESDVKFDSMHKHEEHLHSASMYFWFQTSHQCSLSIKSIPAIPGRLKYT